MRIHDSNGNSNTEPVKSQWPLRTPQTLSISTLALLLFVLLAESTQAQINCRAGSSAPSTSLACLGVVSRTPTGYFPASPLQPTPLQDSLQSLSGEIGAEVSQIPLASPASGIIYANNPTTQLPERLNQSFGPILTQRAQTIGRHNWYFATTYQYFLLEDKDGNALKSLPAVISPLNSLNNPPSGFPDFLGVSNVNLQLKIHQFVGYVTYGLASRVDVSVAVPLLRVDVRETFGESFIPGTCPSSGCAATPTAKSGSSAGEATGVGDVVLATKVNVWKLRRADIDHGGFSLGVEFRLPSGDSHNFLGSGAPGSKPFATFSYAGRFSPHFNIGYQINGKTDLISVPSFSTGTVVKGTLPNRLIYSGGMDIALFKKLTVNVDGIAQRVFDAPSTKVLPANSTTVFGFTIPSPILQPVTASYTRADAAGGLKWNPVRGFLLSGNVSVKLNQAGLRSRVVPLMGASITF